MTTPLEPPDTALIIFTKAPIKGEVKTRLIPSLGAETAVRVYRQLLERNISLAERSTATTKYFYLATQNDMQFFAKYKKWRVELQSEGDLGERMKLAVSETLAKHQHVILMGADMADIRVQDIDTAHTYLSRGSEVVLGPSYDGGYWLIATNRSDLPVYDHIDWGTARVYSQTRSRLRRHDIEFSSLPLRHDVDTSAELRFVNGIGFDLSAPSATPGSVSQSSEPQD